jgi:16S rRNA U1498 N3-methylase RsmE
MAEQAGIEQRTIGPQILRGETAAIATISILQSHLDQLG